MVLIFIFVDSLEKNLGYEILLTTNFSIYECRENRPSKTRNLNGNASFYIFIFYIFCIFFIQTEKKSVQKSPKV